MYCCANCFHHPWLKQRVAELSKQVRRCDYCAPSQEEEGEGQVEHLEVPVIEPGELGPELHRLLSMYEESDSFERGESLIGLIQWHWQIFDEETLSERTRERLLEHIAN